MGSLRDLTTKAWDASFDLNVKASYLTTREVGHYFIGQGSGAIVNIPPALESAASTGGPLFLIESGSPDVHPGDGG